MRVFRDRRDAGRALARRLESYANQPEVIVLALPRGGVPVGYEIARHLGVPLDAMLVRKLGVPGHEELAMGAIASGGIRVVDRSITRVLDISHEELEDIERRERAELERRERAFRGDRGPLEVGGKTVILVDDGLATGASMRAAVEALRTRHPARIVVAAPVGSPEACQALTDRADEVICLHAPDNLYAVGLWYEDFTQTGDQEVRRLLEAAREEYEYPEKSERAPL